MNSFEEARSASRKNLSPHELYNSFFTQQATVDFELLLIAVPQLTRKYAIFSTTSNSWIYLIPRNLSQDTVENQYAIAKEIIGNGKLDAKMMSHAIKQADNTSRIRTSLRNFKKTNSGYVMEIDENENDDNIDETNDEVIQYKIMEKISNPVMPNDSILDRQKKNKCETNSIIKLSIEKYNQLVMDCVL